MCWEPFRSGSWYRRHWACPIRRTVGSKNIGFTNVLRVSGKKAGILTLLGDFGKGWVCGWAAMHWLTVESYIMVVAFAPILGHMFSPFLGFKGGKGVATAVGVVLGLSPSIGLLLLLIWLGAVAIWRYSSGGALAAFACFPSGSDRERTAAGVFHLFSGCQHADLDQAQG